METTFEKFIELIHDYNPDEVQIITKAYEFAKKCHSGQLRESGEPYITHPLAVANILANMHADRDTVCAALLHDVIEDCGVSKSEIAEKFNETISELVDGVTNLNQLNDYATKRKIILSIAKDARIIIIKLADRLHNMLTLQYKNDACKRMKKASETMRFYVPLARYIGAENIRKSLEDLSFQYLYPEDYNSVKEEVSAYYNSKKSDVLEMLENIGLSLNAENIHHELKTRIKNIYSVYRRMKEKQLISNFHDFIAIKVLVDDKKECYDALRIIHGLYQPSNGRFKDYICSPKTNMYSSLHTSVFGPNSVLVQAQIRTHEMERINVYGLTAYWDICKGAAGSRMQELLSEKFQFVKSIEEINRIFIDNQAFIEQVEKEVLGRNIYVYNNDGLLVELPEGSTVVDFAYRLSSTVGDTMVGAFVNGQVARFDTILHSNDRIHIMTDVSSLGPQKEWLNDATTVHAQRAIRKHLSLD